MSTVVFKNDDKGEKGRGLGRLELGKAYKKLDVGGKHGFLPVKLMKRYIMTGGD